MNDAVEHLQGIDVARVRSARIETQVLLAGPEDGEPVVFLHGNLSAATFWEETMLAMPDRFRSVAPDQRGFGGSDRNVLIDATRGVGEWADDVIALADHFGWDAFHLVGHSLGGCVAWRVLGSYSDRLRSVTLFAPGPPCGFGGTHGLDGVLNHEDGAGSGAGLVQPDLVRGIRERDLSDEPLAPRSLMNRLYWKPPFRAPREAALLAAMLQVHLGDRRFPGDQTTSPHWPGIAPGRFGPINALAPLYNQGLFERLAVTPVRPPVLWVYGNDDVVVSDSSVSDPGYQGKLGLRPDWPGENVFPPQPILQQVQHALNVYEQAGGRVRRLILPNVGHTPYLEKPAEAHAALIAHLRCVDE